MKYMRQFKKHQINQLALEGSRGKKRYFEGIEGDKKMRGDLYGKYYVKLYFLLFIIYYCL